MREFRRANDNEARLPRPAERNISRRSKLRYLPTVFKPYGMLNSLWELKRAGRSAPIGERAGARLIRGRFAPYFARFGVAAAFTACFAPDTRARASEDHSLLSIAKRM